MGGSAAAAGMSINDVNAIMVTFSNAGLKGGAAGTSLNAVLRNLSTPTDKAAGALSELNIKLYDQYGASRDMLDIMADLQNELGGLTEEQRNHYQNVIFDSVALKGWNMIVDEGLDAIVELRDELGESTDMFDGLGQASGMAATQIDNFKGDSALAKAAALEFAITMGEMLLPTFRKVMQVITEVTTTVKDFIVENKETVAIVAKVVAGLTAAKIAYLAIKLAILSVVGVHKTLIATKAAYKVIQTAVNSGTKLSTALTMVDTKTKAGQNAVMLMTAKAAWANVSAFAKETASKVASAAATVAKRTAEIAGTLAIKAATAAQWLFNAAMSANPIGLVILAVVGLIAIIVALVKNWDKVKEAAQVVWEVIKDVFSKILEFIKTVWENIKEAFAAAWEFIKAVFGTVGEFFAGAWNTITSVFANVVGWFSSKFTEAWEAVKAVFAGVGAFFQEIWDKIVSLFTSIGTAVGNAIGDAFKFVVNSIIGFAEGLINKFISGINKAIGVINNIPGVNIGLLTELNIPKLEKGSNYTPDTFIAGDVGGKGGELVTNARGYKVFNADATDRILDNISKINAINNALRPAVSDSDTDKKQGIVERIGGFISALRGVAINRIEEMGQKPLPALQSSHSKKQSFTIEYRPTIYVHGDKPGDLEEKLKQNNENLLLMFKEFLRKQREDEWRERFA